MAMRSAVRGRWRAFCRDGRRALPLVKWQPSSPSSVGCGRRHAGPLSRATFSNELLLEYDDGTAPRLVHDVVAHQAADLFGQVVSYVRRCATLGVVHCDLSPYSSGTGRLILIDFPQAVDPVAHRRRSSASLAVSFAQANRRTP